MFRVLHVDELKAALQYHRQKEFMYDCDARLNVIPQYKFSGYHVCDDTWNKAHQQAWVQGWHLKDPNDYIFWFMNQFHDPEIICDFHFKYLKRILKIPTAPAAPKKNELTFTNYTYGLLTLSGMTTDGMSVETKLSNDEGMKYLMGLYSKYFSPDTPRKIPRDFNCNVWIELEKNNNMHMHVFYRRKKGQLKINTGFLQYSKKGLKKGGYNHSERCSSDAHILNQFNYKYDDESSKILKELCHEINSLS